MRTLLLAGAVALGSGLLTVPAAHADAPDVVHGGCHFAASPNAAGDAYSGVIGDASVTTTGAATPAPIGATVTCWIEVDGVTAPGTTHSYGDGTTAAQAGADVVSFAANDTDAIFGCQSTTFADSTTQVDCPVGSNGGGGSCPGGGGGSVQIPPQTLEDLLTVLIQDVNECVFAAAVDPVVCPELVKLAGDYGAVTIGPDGDVSVLDPFGLGVSSIYDCPPYQEL